MNHSPAAARPPRRTHLIADPRLYVLAAELRIGAQLAGELGIPSNRALPMDADAIYRALRGRGAGIVLVTPSAMAAMTVPVEAELRRLLNAGVDVRWPA